MTELWTPGQPIAEQEPADTLYLLACTECPPKVHQFDTDEERDLWAGNHRNWAGHSAFAAREMPKPKRIIL